MLEARREPIVCAILAISSRSETGDSSQIRRQVAACDGCGARRRARSISSTCAAYSANQRMVIRVLRELHGETPAEWCGPSALRLVREAMIRGNPDATPRPRNAWARSVANDFTRIIVHLFK